MKAERLYPQCRPYREAQTLQWDKLTAAELGQGILSTAKAKKSKTIKYLRFSEAGDFRSQADVDKMSAIAEYLSIFDIRVYGYTARQDLDFSHVHPNMVVNGSSFMVHNSFTPVAKGTQTSLLCPGNCRNCKLCKENHQFSISVTLH